MTTPSACPMYSPCWQREIKLLNEDYANTVTAVLVFMAILMTSGIVGNAVLLVVYSMKKTKSSTDYYVLILGVMDLFSCLLVHPYMMYKLTHNFLQDWGWVCKLFEFIAHLSLATSVSIFIAIAIDRFYAVCRPLRFLNTLKLVKILLASLIPMGFLISFPVLEFVGEHVKSARSLDGNYLITTLSCNFKNSYLDSVELIVFRTVLATFFVITVIFISVLYFRVALTAYRRARARVVPTAGNPGPGPSSQTAVAESSSGTAREKSSSVGKTRPNVTVGPSPNGTKVSVVYVKNVDLETKSMKGSADAKDLGSVTSVGRQNSFPDVGQSHSEAESTSLRKSDMTHGEEPVDDSTHPSSSAREEKQKRTFVAISTLGDKFKKVRNQPRSASSSLHAAKMLFAVIAAFFIGWSPYWILVVLYYINEKVWTVDSKSDIIAYQFLIHMYYMNNSINPLIFALYNKQFRQDCKDVFNRHCCRRA